MKYTIEQDRSKGICVIRISGEHKRPEDSFVLQGIALDIRRQTGCTSFLYDMRGATITGKTMDILDTAEAPAKQEYARDFTIALVYSGDMKDHAFMETVSVNHGYSLRVFSNIEEATLWLSSKMSTST